MPKTIHDILREFREDASSERDKGDRFERLIATFLKTDQLYAEQFSNVWMWDEWPGRNNVADTGIDLVAEERATGGLWAIQCKFYDPTHTLQKADIDSFFTASGKTRFSNRMIVCTTDHWSKHAEEALEHQHLPVTRLRVQDLDESSVDWSSFTLRRPQDLKQRAKKQVRPHQKEALAAVKAGFKKADRGKLIMACGTGKTFTALRLAEDLAGANGSVLFLVPSISLMSQSLREWNAEALLSLHSFAVCSDSRVTRQRTDTEDIQVYDLGFPATTDAKRLVLQYESIAKKKRLKVVFATYQSIKVISDAQKKGLPDFDLIICDEAHRTTGVTVAGEDESHFVKVHDQGFLKAKKRLYMTATPRIYSDDAQVKAKEADAALCSMDNAKLYGEELHRLDFSEAVSRDLLTDYKVMVLAVDEKYVSKTFQQQLAGPDGLKLEDYVKITGCWNGLSKRFAAAAAAPNGESDPAPMRRAVAFCSSIKSSKQVKEMFASIIDEYRKGHDDDDSWLQCSVDHVDGTMNALERSKLLDWLKADTQAEGNVCRILSNARCLAEGVDVPALDAVMFLNPRNSVVDVVQSVGRVMRKAAGKRFGYIILPIGIPADVAPEVALKDHQKYKVVWQVLQALRAHDNRFNATVNQIDLNEKRPDQIQVIGVGGGPEDGADGKGHDGRPKAQQLALTFPNVEEWKNAIYAQIVLKCGDRRYWESWAKDVAKIAESHITRIKALLDKPKPKHRKAFDEFLEGLRENLNPNVSDADAIEMLAQHLITKPVFDALFEGYDFTKSNPVSIAMQTMLDLLEEQSLAREQEKLGKFYESVKERARGVDNAAGKQTIIKELYEEFFKTAFPRVAERQGIVYTPIEVVDFIVKSADEALRQEFGVGLTDKGVHILDPFTGTGTFMVRLLQNGLIQPQDLQRKFREELHANEIVLLAYYIAAINIEEAYHGLKPGKYEPFEGIVLTDTFQTAEGSGSNVAMFPENNARLARQRKREIRVIVGNPPYSSGQGKVNDANSNLDYPALDHRIETTYAAASGATNKNSQYDSYVRAFRWASDRIGKSGLICFVTNGSYIDGNSMDGLRKCLVDEFSSIYSFNLRGNQRTSGELSRREGGKIFGAGSRASIAITLLVKNPDYVGPCQVHYYDIGDYLSRDEKLAAISKFSSIREIPWQRIEPNQNHDWINQRDVAFDRFLKIGDKDDDGSTAIFKTYSRGIATSRDAWAYNSSKSALKANMRRMIEFYNDQVRLLAKAKGRRTLAGPDAVGDNDPTKISWSRGLKADFEKGVSHSFDEKSLVRAQYRPFFKQWAYFNKNMNDMIYQMPRIFPHSGETNIAICIKNPGGQRAGFSAFMVQDLPDLHLQPDGAQCFPLYVYEKPQKENELQLAGLVPDKNERQAESINNEVLTRFQGEYKNMRIGKEDIFYYVYGILHSPEYLRRFEADLNKTLPRIPLASDFDRFSKAGRELAKWHLNYETVEPWPLKEHSDQLDLGAKGQYKVTKMTFGKRDKAVDKTTIIYNSHVTLSGIPLEAYDYVVSGRPALEWIMERYQVTVDKDSGIRNDPNDWSEDPRYILDLVKRIVRVSVETMKVINSLPPLNEKK